MAGTILRVSVILGLFAVAVCVAPPAIAQVSPTNTAAISGSVSDSAGKPVANATVSLRGPKDASTKTDSQGLFVFIGVPFGTYAVSVSASGLGTATRSDVAVQGDINVAIQFAPVSGLKTIAHVTSNGNAGFNVTPASVTQVSPMAAAFNGQTSWRKILEQIPGVSQAGLGVGSYPFETLPDGPLMPIQVSINGALPYETATLLDDMPLIGGGAVQSATSAGTGTNLALYPLNGFDAADVIRGPGANAPSIVNSIGGSFVLHAPGMVQTNHYDFSTSSDAYGGIITNALAALRFKNFSVTATYGVNNSPGPINWAEPTMHFFQAPSTIDGLACTGCTSTTLTAPIFANTPAYGFRSSLLICCVTQSTAWSQHSGSLSMTFAPSQALTATVFYAGQSTNQSLTYPAYSTVFAPSAAYSGPIPAGNGTSLLGTEFVNASPTQLGSSLLEERINARIGRGVLRAEALQNRSFDTYGFSTPTSSAYRLYGSASVCSNASTNCSTGTFVPTIFNGDVHALTYRSAFSEYYSIPSSNRDWLISYATELGENFHAGASFVKSYYNAPCFLTFSRVSPSNGSTTTLGQFTVPSSVSQGTTEGRIFVGGTLGEKTSFDLSMYSTTASYHVQNPSDASGNTFVDKQYTYSAPRLGVVWRPSSTVALRGAVGGGFAEAPLPFLVGASGQPNCSSGIYCTVTLTNLDLQPEKSFSFDVGADVRLPRSTIASFDLYRSNLYGQLFVSNTSSGSCPTCGGLPLYATQYRNLGLSRYEGILIDVRHDVPRGVYWSFSGGLTRAYPVSVPSAVYAGINFPPPTFSPTPCTNCSNLNVVPGVNFNGTYTDGVSVPYAQALATVGYRWAQSEYANVVATYFGNNNSYFRPAFVEFDGHLSFPISKSGSILMTFRNITGIYGAAYPTESLSNLAGVPTVSGLPYGEYGQEYGPRTVLFTLRIRE